MEKLVIILSNKNITYIYIMYIPLLKRNTKVLLSILYEV